MVESEGGDISESATVTFESLRNQMEKQCITHFSTAVSARAIRRRSMEIQYDDASDMLYIGLH